MPSLNNYKIIHGNYTNGERRKIQSDDIILNSWNEDIQSKTAFIYDFFHDDEPYVMRGMKSNESKTKTPIDIKFIVNAYNSENKDEVGFHVQFKPRYDWRAVDELKYYQDYINYYASEFPIGMYLDIYDDEIKEYRKWIITEYANTLGNQFPTWYILPCDYLFQWVYKNKLYQMCGVSRSQNSYNSGIYTDFKITKVENQRKCILPMNKISATIFYNTRIVISAPIAEPVTWSCSKVEQTSPKGISHLTFWQETWNDHSDAFQYDDNTFSSVYDENKCIIGMWADYYSSSIAPTIPEEEVKNIYGKITYSGSPQIKVGGSAKKLTLKFYEDDVEISVPNGSWSYYINDKDVSDLVSTDYIDNVLKLKFIGDESHIGEVMNVTYTTNTGVTATVKIEIRGL